MLSYIFKDDYQNFSGKNIKIRNINFAKISDLINFNWELIKQSHINSSIKFIDSGCEKASVLVYKNPMNNKEGARIYSDYDNYKYTYHNDDILIAKLQERQSFIKLTEFPYGIITVGNKIIGQQIPFYDGYIEIGEAINKETKLEQIINYGFKLVDIFAELLDCDIYYSDIHLANILVNPIDNDVKLIDFEEPFVTIIPALLERDFHNKIIANKVSILIQDLCYCKSIKLNGIVPIANSLRELKNYLYEASCKLIKK